VSRGDAERIADIQAAAQKLAEIVQQGRSAFDEQWVLQVAAERLVEIVGEAASHLSDDLRNRRPDSLRAAKDMRNLIAHEYHRVDPHLLWEAIASDIPRLADDLSSEDQRPGLGLAGSTGASSRQQPWSAPKSEHSVPADSPEANKRDQIERLLRRGKRTHAEIARTVGGQALSVVATEGSIDAVG
jgi:uncharacterized protein with HEPN domain